MNGFNLIHDDNVVPYTSRTHWFDITFDITITDISAFTTFNTYTYRF